MASAPPPIVLDTTLRGLYAAEGDGDDITLAYAMPTAEVQMSAGIPPASSATSPPPVRPTTATRSRVPPARAAALRLRRRQDVPNHVRPRPRRALRRRHQADTHRLLGRLAPLQRPALTFIPFPAAILHPTTRLAIANLMDCLLPIRTSCPRRRTTPPSPSAPSPSPPTHHRRRHRPRPRPGRRWRRAGWWRCRYS